MKDKFSKKTLASIVLLPVFALAFSSLSIVHAADPYITLNSYSGRPGDSFNVSGHSFFPNENISINFNGTNNNTTANNNGDFTSSNFTVPYVTEGNYMVSVRGAMSGAQKTANYYIVGFYPKAQPTTYYILRGQTLGFSGSNFAPNEKITLYGPEGVITTFTADGSGNFSTSKFYTLSYYYSDTKVNFHVVGNSSNARVDMDLTVGNFYPNMKPSTYYISKNTSMSVNGTGFAPNEQVQLTINGSTTSKNADGSGNVNFNFTTPSSGSSFDIILRGVLSSTYISRTITLAQ